MKDKHTMLLQILLITHCFQTIFSSCEVDLPLLTKWNALERCCPQEFAYICCPDVPRCPDDFNSTEFYTRGRQKNPAQFPLEENPWTPPPCINPDDIDCQEGFVSDQDGKVLTAPGGFFSPAGLRCAVPCVYGSYCPETFLHKPDNFTMNDCTQNSKCCKYLDGSIAAVSAEIANNGSELVCPGSSKWDYCPKSYFCPDPSNKTECSQSSLCPRGEYKPLPCNLLHECARGGEYVSKWVAILFLLVMLILSCVVYALYQYRKEVPQHLYTLLNMLGRTPLAPFITCVKKWLKIKPPPKSLRYGLNMSLNESMESSGETIGRIKQPITITFKDLNFGTAGRQILNNVNGKFEHGTVTAIMGPSGCGKTTIMNILRGKIRKDVTGDIRWNNEPLHDLENTNSVIGYAPQEDIMHGQLTVKEVLTYRANITCATWKSEKQKKKYVQSLMGVLGIAFIADSLVGGEDERGISGGQKRRLNVGMELVGNPTILFCDEPTSGLDSSTSLDLIQTMRNIAESSGINIICVIHQPRYECFALFNNLLLLSNKGRVVYEGDPADAKEYFQYLGFPYVPQSNPADYIIDIANGAKPSDECTMNDLPFIWEGKSKNEKVTDKRKIWALRRHRQTASDATIVGLDVKTSREREHEFVFAPPPKPSLLKQLIWLFRREVLLQIRNSGQFLMEIIVSLLIGGLLGGMYAKPSLNTQVGKLAMASLCLGILSVIMAMKFIGNNWSNVLREADNGISMLGYYLAVNLISLPGVVVTIPLGFLAIYHTVSDTRTDFLDHYINFVCTIFAASGYGLLVSSAVPRHKMYMIALGVILMLVFGGGSNMSICDMSKITLFGPALYYSSFAKWFIEAQYESEVQYYSDAMEWTIQYYAERNLYTLDNRNTCLLALFVIGVVTRVLGFMAIKFRTR